jgi:hypothetical protein
MDYRLPVRPVPPDERDKGNMPGTRQIATEALWHGYQPHHIASINQRGFQFPVVFINGVAFDFKVGEKFGHQ